jgi:hypothetical protein
MTWPQGTSVNLVLLACGRCYQRPIVDDWRVIAFQLIAR